MSPAQQKQRPIHLAIAGALAIFLCSAGAQTTAPAGRNPPPAAHAAADAGYKAFERKDYAAAVEHAQRAVQLAPDRRDYWLLLAQAQLAAGQMGGAQQSLDRAAQASGDDAALARARADFTRARAQASGAAMYQALQANDLTSAIAHGRLAVADAPENAGYRLALVHALVRAAQLAEAERVAGETLALLPDSAAPLALRGYARHQLGRTAEAAADLDRALQQRGLPPPSQRQIRLLAADLALSRGDGAKAAELLQPLQASDTEAAARRDLARARASSGGAPITVALPALDCANVVASQTCTVLAGSVPLMPGHAAAGAAYRALEQKDAQRALELAREATAASPGQRDWQLLRMNAALAAGQVEEAKQAAAAARALGDDMPGASRLDLAYFSTRVGDHQAARESFRQADAAGGLPPTSLLDAGYASMRARQDDEAVGYFKRAIDAVDSLQLKLEPQMVYDTRRAVAEISRKWGVLASLTMSNGGSAVPLFGSVGGPGGRKVTQAGVEAYWRPWGFRNGQFVELFARGFQTLHSEAGGLEGSDSFQGALGARWKPLSGHNAVLSLSRVFGPEVEGDWLAQAAYSLDLGTDLRVDVPSWWTTRISAEVGRYLEGQRNYALGSVMFGRSFLVGGSGRTVVYPHAVVAADYSSVESPKSAIGAGPGVSVRHWFREDKYTAPRSYVDMTLQYRARISGADRGDGVYFNTLLSY
ncbi:tetratricopeptide repeat protein [Caenimonas sedimenti]|uniref:Tetratricopeptide repeat protein n=1 Tax=Caenimonas sedimenti TaxID=2596921 RepID=A0A562ZT79_9BURK|nr:tetratricopeptide repeat protein [Caenimonas sedimenti]TWO71607.1 tetratricopeptide repeat protein [Caenimonas sedimenti]